MKTSFVISTLMVLLVPALAGAARQTTFERNRNKVIRTEVAAFLNQTRYVPPTALVAPIEASQLRVYVRPDLSHRHGGPGGHLHIVGHSPWVAKWTCRGLGQRVAGTCNANNLAGDNGTGTTVSNVAVTTPPSWGQAPGL